MGLVAGGLLAVDDEFATEGRLVVAGLDGAKVALALGVEVVPVPLQPDTVNASANAATILRISTPFVTQMIVSTAERCNPKMVGNIIGFAGEKGLGYHSESRWRFQATSRAGDVNGRWSGSV